MKSTYTLFLSIILTISTYSQSSHVVNIVFDGITNFTKNYKVTIDKSSYYSNKNYNTSGDQNTLSVNTMATGRHTLIVYRLSNNNPKYNSSSKKVLISKNTFMLKAGYDMDITINVTGQVQFYEKLSPVVAPVNYKIPMSINDYNQLLQKVRSKFSQALKGETESEAFNNSNNYFSTSQIRQLLTLISSENDRLDLAKLSYRAVTDSSNFIQLYDLFKMQNSKDDLNDFLRSRGWNIPDNPNGIKVQMTDNKFSQLVQNVKNKFSQALKGETESEAFNNPANYFNISQVRQLLNLITSETDRLDLAKFSYRSLIDTSSFVQLYDLFRLQASKDELNNFLRAKGWNIYNDQTSIKVAMAENKFNTLLQQVKNKWSQALKGEAESEAFNNPNNYFNTTQVRQLLNLMTQENDQLDLAKLSYRTIIDSANFILLGDLFKTQVYKDQFNTFLRSKGWTISSDQNTIIAPMADADFNDLLSNVRGNLIQFLKMNYERDIFNNPNYHFTTNQIRQLILLINSENNRLELAKLSYRTATDPTNFLQLSNLLDSQSSKDELSNYVRNYRR